MNICIFEPVKFIASILSVYILLLLVVPCCAFDNCASDKTPDSESSTEAHKAADKDGCGNCSPFSFCQSCNGFINSIKVTDIRTQLLMDVPQKKYLVYSKFYHPRYFANIWQPPKIA